MRHAVLLLALLLLAPAALAEETSEREGVGWMGGRRRALEFFVTRRPEPRAYIQFQVEGERAADVLLDRAGVRQLLALLERVPALRDATPWDGEAPVGTVGPDRSSRPLTLALSRTSTGQTAVDLVFGAHDGGPAAVATFWTEQVVLHRDPLGRTEVAGMTVSWLESLLSRVDERLEQLEGDESASPGCRR